jgi:hypothetical protein
MRGSAQNPVRLDDRQALRKLMVQPPMVRPRWAIQVEHKVVLRHTSDPAFESHHETWFHGEFEIPDAPALSPLDQPISATPGGIHSWRDTRAGPCAAYRSGPIPIEVNLRGLATVGNLPAFILSFQGNPQQRSSYQVTCTSPDGESQPSPLRTVTPFLPPPVMLPRQAGTYLGPSQLISSPLDAVSVETKYTLTAGCVATPAPALRYAFNVTLEVPEARLHHDRTRGQIRALSGGSANSIGLTIFDLGMESKIDATFFSTGEEDDDCFWASEINVAFRYRSIDVYLVREYPEGSCEYQATLDHENQHVRADRAVVEKFVQEVRAAFAPLMAGPASVSLPTYARPRWNTPFREAMQQAKAELDKILQPNFARMSQARTAAADALDTARRYEETKRRCTGW